MNQYNDLNIDSMTSCSLNNIRAVIRGYTADALPNE